MSENSVNCICKDNKSEQTLMGTNIVNKALLRFKPYDQLQVLQVPLKIEELIPACHLVRIVNDCIEKLDMSCFEEYYSSFGCPAFHPKMMIKVWIYAYCERIYTSRRLCKAMRENVNFIWLSGNQHPCFKTLCDFRSNKMESMVDTIFKEVLLMLVELGYIDLDTLYIDGSKWEANANRYKVTYKKNTIRYKEQVLLRINDLLQEIKQLQNQEDATYGTKNLPEIGESLELSVVLNSEEVHQHLISLQDLVAQQSEDDKGKTTSIRRLKTIEKTLSKEVEKVEKYERQEVILGDRNSYSHTDPDATVLRMKREESLPAYNIQHSTNNQYIVNYTVSQNSSDSPTLAEHLDKMEERLEGIRFSIAQKSPHSNVLIGINCVADAGYGSEENYADCQKRGIIAFIKYPLWYQEQTGELLKKKYNAYNWTYDEGSDSYTCPNDRKVVFKEHTTRTSINGYQRHIKLYQCETCDDCPFANDCKKTIDKPRTISFSPQGEVYKQQAKELLDTPEGKEKRSQRSIEVESAFGDIKFNMQYDRFILRGKQKVYIEYGILSMAHNLRKVYCQQSGCWKDYYAQRASKKGKKA
jgi:transposase